MLDGFSTNRVDSCFSSSRWLIMKQLKYHLKKPNTCYENNISDSGFGYEDQLPESMLQPETKIPEKRKGSYN